MIGVDVGNPVQMHPGAGSMGYRLFDVQGSRLREFGADSHASAPPIG